METKNYVFMRVNLQNFLVFDSEVNDKGCINPIALIGHTHCKNIVITPCYWDDYNLLLDFVEINLDVKITREWAVKSADGVIVDTWDGALLKKYKLVEDRAE